MGAVTLPVGVGSGFWIEPGDWRIYEYALSESVKRSSRGVMNTSLPGNSPDNKFDPDEVGTEGGLSLVLPPPPSLPDDTPRSLFDSSSCSLDARSRLSWLSMWSSSMWCCSFWLMAVTRLPPSGEKRQYKIFSNSDPVLIIAKGSFRMDQSQRWSSLLIAISNRLSVGWKQSDTRFDSRSPFSPPK